MLGIVKHSTRGFNTIIVDNVGAGFELAEATATPWNKNPLCLHLRTPEEIPTVVIIRRWMTIFLRLAEDNQTSKKLVSENIVVIFEASSGRLYPIVPVVNGPFWRTIDDCDQSI